MGLGPALLVIAALGVLGFGVLTAGRAEARKRPPSGQHGDGPGDGPGDGQGDGLGDRPGDRQGDRRAQGTICIKLIWAGLGLFVAGLVACIVAYNWQVPYGGALTGLGPALALAAALCVMGLGVIVVLVAIVVAAGAESRRKRAAEEPSAEALPGNDS